jgi:hypothetical protein
MLFDIHTYNDLVFVRTKRTKDDHLSYTHFCNNDDITLLFLTTIFNVHVYLGIYRMSIIQDDILYIQPSHFNNLDL